MSILTQLAQQDANKVNSLPGLRRWLNQLEALREGANGIEGLDPTVYFLSGAVSILKVWIKEEEQRELEGQAPRAPVAVVRGARGYPSQPPGTINLIDRWAEEGWRLDAAHITYDHSGDNFDPLEPQATSLPIAYTETSLEKSEGESE